MRVIRVITSEIMGTIPGEISPGMVPMTDGVTGVSSVTVTGIMSALARGGSL